MRPRRVRIAALLAAVVAGVVAAPPAHAAFHLMKVVEVFPGTAAQPDAQFVELQMFANGQNFVNGHAIRVYNASGVQTNVISFTSDVASGANQSSILVATTQAATLFGIAADLTMPPVLPLGGGKVCFDGFDCVAWGSYSGPTAGVGSSFHPDGGLVPGSAAQRRIDRGNPSLLDASDDTDDSASDLRFGAPKPRNNAGATFAGGCTLTTGLPATMISEGSSLELTLSACPGATATVTAVPGSADIPEDLDPVSQAIAFDETLQQVTIQTLSDELLEGTERFTIRIRDVHGAFLAVPDLELSILDVAPPIEGVPGTPAQVTVARGIRELTVTWQPPVGGEPVETYVVYAGGEAGPRSPIATLAHTARSFTETGLGDEQTRSYVIAAANQAGEGPQPPPVIGTTYGRPTAPIDLVAVPGTLPGEVRLSWTPPVDNGGLSLTSYVIYEASQLAGNGFQRAGEAPGSATTILLGGRTPLSEHRYLLAAVSPVGEGPVSAEDCTRPGPWLATLGCGIPALPTPEAGPFANGYRGTRCAGSGCGSPAPPEPSWQRPSAWSSR